MQDRPQLIFDVAGVLISNFSPTFWEEMVTFATDRSAAEMHGLFKEELRHRLWTGALPATAFFGWMASHLPATTTQEVERILYDHLTPLPAIERIPAWSRSADLHLLTNHRGEWITPLLAPVRHYITNMTVSSEVGYCKPDQRMYQLAHEKLHPIGPSLYVDDQQKNLVPASALGWHTLLADQAGHWVETVDKMLN
ncbi:HAD family hydrolase [Paenibacillus guangzhouensis]|uniref:HAD family hydrolase n=1 Tax=Paenibacillus guangzhouensis TaxID=1473112 RepID=UPI001266BBAA|nr:HAD-IA family hydrolase [Paenibacillus guangzhouensis]